MPDMSDTTDFIAVGVNGLLIMRRDSLVECAFKRVAAVWRTSKGSGGVEGMLVAGTTSLLDRMSMNLSSKVINVEAAELSASKPLGASLDLVDIIARPVKIATLVRSVYEARCG